jgi:hypothetical protein
MEHETSTFNHKTAKSIRVSLGIDLEDLAEGIKRRESKNTQYYLARVWKFEMGIRIPIPSGNRSGKCSAAHRYLTFLAENGYDPYGISNPKPIDIN